MKASERLIEIIDELDKNRVINKTLRSDEVLEPYVIWAMQIMISEVEVLYPIMIVGLHRRLWDKFEREFSLIDYPDQAIVGRGLRRSEVVEYPNNMLSVTYYAVIRLSELSEKDRVNPPPTFTANPVETLARETLRRAR